MKERAMLGVISKESDAKIKNKIVKCEKLGVGEVIKVGAQSQDEVENCSCSEGIYGFYHHLVTESQGCVKKVGIKRLRIQNKVVNKENQALK